MLEAHLHAVDLNLLLVLDVLLDERSVTRAAARLGKTQSGVSRALARLRTLLDDPLLVREGAALLPTPRAEAVREPLRRILTQVQLEVLRSERFDPARSDRTFTLAAADYLESLLLPTLVASMQRAAPGVSLVVSSAPRPMSELVEEVDVVVGPMAGGGAATRTRALPAEPFAVLVRRDHPRVGEELDLETWLALPHLLVTPRNRPGGIVDDALALIGRSRRVAVRVPSFLVAPRIVAESDLVLTLPARFAERASRGLPVRILPPPIELAPFVPTLGWHPRWHHDPGHAWFRDQIARAVT
jgi:DNA-binding transcriptional LysR family regulator